MRRRGPKPLPPPTDQERRDARAAALALRQAIADPAQRGAESVAHFDLARPRRGVWLTTWANLPGFYRENGRFFHDCLPGWTYSRAEVRLELIPDLESLAERGERPTEETTPRNR